MDHSLPRTAAVPPSTKQLLSASSRDGPTNGSSVSDSVSTTHEHTPISSNSSSSNNNNNQSLVIVPPQPQQQPLPPQPTLSQSPPPPSQSVDGVSDSMERMAIDDDRRTVTTTTTITTTTHYNNAPPNSAASASNASTASHTGMPLSSSPTPSSSSSSLAAPSSSSASSSSASSKKKAISYAAERVIGNGSFGVVYQATVIDTGETVAIKKVLQDRRFKNRELEIMSTLQHPNVVGLRHCFYSKGEKPEEVYLNLVMEYIPETIHRTLRNHTKANKLVPVLYTKVYMYQIARALAYIHSQGICHRDIKPQNLLLNPKTHEVKLCDFGSAKSLRPGEPNVSYICSRYYRAPELVFEATEYSAAIDVWSLGCVFVELLIGNPLFPGDSGVGQLIEIIKVLGSPTRDEVLAMNPTPTSFRFPHISPQPWSKVFKQVKVPASAIDLAGRWLKYKPTDRMDPFDSLLHPFFDELREEGVRMPNGRELPELFEWRESEREKMRRRGGGLYERMTPRWYRLRKGEAVEEEPPASSAAAGAGAQDGSNGHSMSDGMNGGPS